MDNIPDFHEKNDKKNSPALGGINGCSGLSLSLRPQGARLTLREITFGGGGAEGEAWGKNGLEPRRIHKNVI
jgi:hypothetical protein